MAAARKGKSRKAGGGKRKGSWGGRRPGAGRPKGSGSGPSPDARRNRVAIMLNDRELEQLRGLAREERRPVSTVAYSFVARALGRARG